MIERACMSVKMHSWGVPVYTEPGCLRRYGVAKEKKLNSMRFLEQHRVEYKVHYYDEELHSAPEVAQALGVEPERVFKTLVVLPLQGKPVLAVIPGNHELDLKALARAAAEKKLSMASHKEAEQLTGLKVGGISSLALMQKNWRIFLDTSARNYEHIFMSAGQRGINLEVPVEGFIEVTGAHENMLIITSRSIQKDAPILLHQRQ